MGPTRRRGASKGHRHYAAVCCCSRAHAKNGIPNTIRNSGHPPTRRILEAGLPADTLEAQANYTLKYWVDWGSPYYGDLDEVLAPIIARHQARLEVEEQLQLRAERRTLIDDRWAQSEPTATPILRSGA